jgi:capsular polysaccharide transport system permease protein
VNPDTSWQAGSPLRVGAVVQLRVIHALMMREVITRFGRHNLGVLWLIGEPMLFTAGVAALWSLVGLSHRSELPIVAFAVTGYSSVLMWRNTVSRCNAAVVQNRNLLYHRRVKVLDILASRIVLECAAAVASFTVLTLGMLAAGWVQPPEDSLKVLGGLALLAWFSAGLGLLIGAAASLSELVDRIWHPTAYLMLPLSGAGYMVDWLPPQTQAFALALPMVHCLEFLREGYFGSVVRTHHDLFYVVLWCMALTLAGLLLVRLASRKVEGL